VKPPVGAGSIAGLPVRKQVALGLSWLFLQPSNSQRSSCQIRNTRTPTASVDPYAANPGKATERSFQNERCHLFHLFYQDQIRLGCPRPVEEPWAEPDHIGIGAIIGHAHCGGPLESLPTADISLSMLKKAININAIKARKTRK
jgi:hypothetical protein